MNPQCIPAFGGIAHKSPLLLPERAHDAVKGGFRLEADARDVGQADEAVLDRAVVGEAAEGGEHVGVAFVAAKAEPDRDVERELVAAMRYAAP